MRLGRLTYCFGIFLMIGVAAPTLWAQVANQPPVLVTDPASLVQNVRENDIVTFILKANDPDGDQLTYTFTVTQGPAITDTRFQSQIIRNPNVNATNQFTVPPGTVNTVIIITVEISDGHGNSITQDVTFHVTGINHPPTVTLVATQGSTGVTGTSTDPFQTGSIQIKAVVDDPDGDTKFTPFWSFSLKTGGGCLGAAPPSMLKTEGLSPSLTIPTSATLSSYEVDLKLQDGGNFVKTSTAVYIAAEGCQTSGNKAPTNLLAQAVPAQASFGQTISLTGSATDPDNDPLTFTWFVSVNTTTNKGIQFATGKTATYQAPNQDATLLFTLQVSDGKAPPVSTRITVTVGQGGGSSGGPTPQQCGACGGISNLTVDAGPPTVNVVGGDSLPLSAVLRNPSLPNDSGLLFVQVTWSIVENSLPPGLQIEKPTNRQTKLLTPKVTQGQTIHVRLTVDACTCSDEIQVSILPQTSDSQNQNPTAVASADKSDVKSGEKVILDGSQSSDPDGDTLSFSWTSDSGNPPGVEFSSVEPDNSKVSILAPSVENTTLLKFNLNVSDSKGGSSSAQVSVTVQPNHVPVIEKISDQAVGGEGLVTMSANVGTVVDLNAQASDEDGDTLTYHWEQLSGTTVDLHNADQSDASFEAPSGETSTLSLSFKLTVSDGSAEVNATVQVNVLKVSALLFPVAPLLTANPLFGNIFVGVAIVNPNANPNSLALAAVDKTGNSSPVQPPKTTLQGLGQDAFLTSEVTSLPEGVASLLAQGQQGPIQGFFMLGDGSGKLKRLDGIGGELKKSKELFFPIARQDDTQATLMFLFNPQDPSKGSEGMANVTLKLMDDAGNVMKESSQVLTPQGTISGTLDELFEEGLQVADGYVQVESDQELKGFEFYATPENFASANGQLKPDRPLDLLNGNVLSVPQFFVDNSGGDTEIRLLNVGDSKIFAKVQAFLQTGLNSYDSVESDDITIEAGQLFVGSTKELLNLDTSGLSPGEFINGYLNVTIKGQNVGPFPGPASVLGVVTFRINDGKSLSTLPIIRDGSADAVFLQVAQDDILFTGLAILNRSNQDADVKVEVFDENGVQTGEFETTIPAGNRLIGLLPSFFGSGFQQVKGHIRVISTQPVMTFALFGNLKQDFLSAIEGQKPLN